MPRTRCRAHESNANVELGHTASSSSNGGGWACPQTVQCERGGQSWTRIDAYCHLALVYYRPWCSCATPEAAIAVPDGKKPRAAPQVCPSSASITDVPRDADDSAPACANAADPSKPASTSPVRAAAWESVPGLQPDRAAVASPPGSRSVHQRRAIASLSHRLRELLGDPNVPGQGDTATDGLPTAWVANRHAGRLLVYLRLSLERLLSADGLAALETYVEACGPNPPVRTTPGGSVVLVGAGNRRGDPVQAFHAACRILPTFSPRELATDIIPTVHALHRWEATALALAHRRLA